MAGVESSEVRNDIFCEPSTSFSTESTCISHEDSVSSTVTSNSEITVEQETETNLSEMDITLEDMDFEKSEDEFFFDTDHPALKANKDYRKLLNTVLLLEARRGQAIRDLEQLYECREAALADPISFVDKLQRGIDLNLPKPRPIPQIPDIDWNQYTISVNDSGCERRQLTRQSTKIMSNILSPARSDFEEEKKPTAAELAKAAKANKSWSAEEQRKLEELLVKYPPEEIETRRWEKIANELENRTPIQVASRVQKYFIKLMKAGMPIPGRQPNACYNRKPRRQVVRQQPSTFFASFTNAIFMDDDENSGSNYLSLDNPDESSESSDDSEEEISEDVKKTDEYKEYLEMKRAVKQKKKLSGVAQHVGFKCQRCECEPIIGVRWHCLDCTESIDFCEDCIECNHETGTHTSKHRLEPIKDAVYGSLDFNYLLHRSSNQNYLDPNYCF